MKYLAKNFICFIFRNFFGKENRIGVALLRLQGSGVLGVLVAALLILTLTVPIYSRSGLDVRFPILLALGFFFLMILVIILNLGRGSIRAEW